ncbi:MAG TPA: DUF3307 domain-containing protein [Daejeonella sp.]|nr:DUF3307 domain-containing protein [Daejeonella sp.]
MISEEISVFLRLIIAHLLTDFALQPSSWIVDRMAKKYRSGKLYLHALVTAVVAYVLAGIWAVWWLPLYVFVTHLGIDIWKSYRPAKTRYFIMDQLLHLIALFILWISIFHKWAETGILITNLYGNNTYLIIIAAYLIIGWPLGIMIGIATEKWRNESRINSEGLARAGMWIGFLERFLILTFILIDQYTAVGLLIAAKSILRFNDKEFNTQKKTEYVLIGTLMSFSVAVLLAWMVNFALAAV